MPIGNEIGNEPGNDPIIAHPPVQPFPDVAIVVGSPLTHIAAGLCLLEAGSDGTVHVPLTAVSNEDGTAFDLTIYPVAIAFLQVTPTAADFQEAQWLTLPPTSTGVDLPPTMFVRITVSTAAGNTLAAGNYRMYILINGTILLRSATDLSVRS